MTNSIDKFLNLYNEVEFADIAIDEAHSISSWGAHLETHI